MLEEFLHYVSSKDALQSLLVLEQMPDINISNMLIDMRNTPLSMAIEHQMYSVARVLIERNANVNAINSVGMTPLHYACSHAPDLDFIELLLEQGASINAVSVLGNYPIHLACNKNGCKELVRLLVLAGADVDTVSSSLLRTTPLLEATGSNNIDVMLELLLLGADVHSTTTENKTPLKVAHEHGYTDAISLLEKFGAKY